MKIRVASCLFMLCLLLLAFEWPVSKVIITATFGESRGDHLHSGIDLAGEEQEIKPISPGSVVFYYDEGATYSSVPVGLGSFLVLEDATGIRSLYAHLKKRTIDPERLSYQKDDTIGIMGDTGYSLGRHLHLTIIDHKEKTILNPLVVYKNEAKIIEDKIPPVIEQLYYENRQGELAELPAEIEYNADKIGLYLRADDSPGRTGGKVAPFAVQVMRNEMKVVDIRFNALLFKDGRYYLESCGKSFEDLYPFTGAKSDILSLGQVGLINGKNHLVITVRDFNGNTSAMEVDVWVSSPL
jgi:hypothetical protein